MQPILTKRNNSNFPLPVGSIIEILMATHEQWLKEKAEWPVIVHNVYSTILRNFASESPLLDILWLTNINPE